MKRHVVPVVVMLSVLGGIFFFLVHSTWFFNYFGPAYIKRQLKEYTLEKFHVQSQKFSFPETFVLQDVVLSLVKDDKLCELTVKELTLYEFLTYLKKKENIKVMVQGLNLRYDRLVLNNLNIKGLIFFQGHHFSQLNGIFAGYRVEVFPYLVTNFEGQLRGTRTRIQLTDLVADAYGGTVKGQVVMEYVPQVNYICWLEAVDLKTECLAETRHPLFSSVHGEVSGAMRFIWGAKQVNLMAVHFQFNKGGALDSGLVEEILGFPGNTAVKNQLHSMRSGDGRLQVDQGKIRLQNSGEYRLSLEYELAREQQGVRLKEKHEIPVPAGLSRFLFPEREETP